MEDKGYAVEFKNKQSPHQAAKESSPKATQVIKFREGNMYKLKGEIVHP